MSRTTPLLLCLLFGMAGCSSDKEPETPTAEAPDNLSPPPGLGGSSGGGDAGGVATINDGTAQLSGENTRIQFVGSKPTGETHDGGFTQLSGSATTGDGNLSALDVEIQTESLWSDNERLTGHLKSADFFNVREHETITFKSASIEPASDGQVNITGDLTMLGTTKSIQFPATVRIDDDQLEIDAQFEVDRTQFGMNYGEGQVNPQVKISVAVGQGAAEAPGAAGAGEAAGGRGGRGGGGGRGNFSPESMFSQRDADGDGKLSGDEIPDRMKENLENIDQDGDGAVTLEEMTKAFENFRRQGGGGAQAPDGQ